jgi:hypothetical protein
VLPLPVPIGLVHRGVEAPVDRVRLRSGIHLPVPRRLVGVGSAMLDW